MSRRDKFHVHFRDALEDDGWEITDDPYMLRLTDTKGKPRDYPVDIGAEKFIAAEKDNLKIAVEIKTFGGSSTIRDYHEALGQYMDYIVGLMVQEPERKLYLAVSQQAYKEIQANPLARISVQHYKISIVIFDPVRRSILKWIR